MRGSLRGLVVYRDPLSRLARGIVLLAGALLGAALVGWISQLIHPGFSWRTGIISSAVLERYPKPYETYLYLALVGLLPLAALLALTGHLAVGRRRPAAGLLDGLSHLVVPAWYLVGWNGSGSVRSLILIPVALLLGCRLVAYRLSAGHPHAPTPASPPTLAGRDLLPEPLALPVILCSLPAGALVGAAFVGHLPTGAAAIVGTFSAVAAALITWVTGSLLSKVLVRVTLREALRRDALTFLIILPVSLGWVRPLSWHGFGVAAGFVTAKILAWRYPIRYSIAGRRVWWLLLVPVILYCYLYRPAIGRPLDFFEDGVRLAPASEMLRGEQPYRENFLYHGLFEDAWKSLLSFRLWGTSVSSYVRMDHLLLPLGAIGGYFLCSAVLGSTAQGLAVVVGLVLLGHEPPARFACAMAGLALLVTAVRTPRLKTAFACGAFLSLAVFQSLESGAGGWAIAVLFLILWCTGGRARRLGRLWSGLALGCCAVSVPIGVYLASSGALGAFFRTSLSLLLPLEDRLSLPFLPRILHEAAGLVTWAVPGRQAAKTLMLVAPLPLVIWAVTRLLLVRVQRKWDLREVGALAAAVGGFVLYRGVIQRPDTFHLNKMMVFTAMLWTIALASAWALRSAGWRGLLAGLAQTAALVPFALLALQVAVAGAAQPLLARIKGEPPGLRSCAVARAGDMRVPSEQAHRIEQIVGYLQDELAPDEPFFEFSLAGLLYFLAERPNPTPFPHSTFAGSTREQRQVIRVLEQKRPRLVLFPTGRWEQRYEEMGSYLRQPLLAKYLYEHYVPTKMVAGFLILKRQQEDAEAGTAVVSECSWPPADMGYLPVLYGLPAWEPRGLESVATFTPAGIVADWKVSSGYIVTPADGVFAECIGDTNGVELIGPPMSFNPLVAQWLDVTAGTNSRQLVVEWSTAAPRYRGETHVVCRTAGHAERRHLLELGCLPTWTWSGGISRLRLHWPEPGCRVRLRSISLMSQSPAPDSTSAPDTPG